MIYCGVCTLPPEFCEFGGNYKRCREWLQKMHPEMFEKLYSHEDEAFTHSLSSLSLEKKEEIEQKFAKQRAKEEARAQRELDKKLSSKIVLRRIERNKRKHIISVTGLESWGGDLKKLAKQFASRFATGASVTKTPDGKDEVLVQGDVGEELADMLRQILDKDGLEHLRVELSEETRRKR